MYISIYFLIIYRVSHETVEIRLEGRLRSLKLFEAFVRQPIFTWLIFVTLITRAREGRRPWATTNSPSVPHISFFSLSVAMSHHYFPTTTFDSSGQNYFFKWYIYYLGPLKCDFKKSSRVTQKKHNSIHFFNST